MKKSTMLAFITLILSSVTLAITARAQDSIIVSGNPYAPPVVWEEYKKLVGLGPDLATAILNSLEITHNYQVFNDWKQVQQKTQDGKVDLIVSAYKNQQREEYLSFSIPYLAQPVVIIVEKGKEFRFSSWDALKGKRGVSNIGESYGQKFDEFIQDNLSVKYYQFERALQLMNLGEADYLIVDLYTALIYARLLQGEDSITILDPPVTVQDFHMAIRSDSTLAARLPEINSKLGEQIKSGMVSDTLLKHFDKWQELIERRAGYFSKGKQARSEQQVEYLKEQDAIARQRIIGTMVNREGLPPAVQ